MPGFESEHYRFHYSAGSFAEKHIRELALRQEKCFAYICRVLQVKPDRKLQYFLCETPEEVGAYYGDEEPCDGFAREPDRIYAVYNERCRCDGFHEDAHLISFFLHKPPQAAVREGLAMAFDRQWWGICNFEWALYYREENRLPPFNCLLENERFFALDCGLSYPIVGAFTEYLLLTYGTERYRLFWQKENGGEEGFRKAYGKTTGELSREFEQYLTLFSLDGGVRERIAAKLSGAPASPG